MVVVAYMGRKPTGGWGYNVQYLDPRTKDTEDIIGTVRDRLAGYKKPKKVIFLDELPRNPTGKILKRELREL